MGPRRKGWPQTDNRWEPMILNKLNDWIFKISGVVSTFFLGAIVVLTFAQVVCRYFIHYSITWATEVSVYMLIWMIFLSCSMGYRANKICSLTILTDRLPRKVAAALSILGQLFMIAFFALTFYGNIEIISLAWRKVSSILGFPLKYEYGAWSAVAVIMTLYALEKIIASIKVLSSKEGVQ